MDNLVSQPEISVARSENDSTRIAWSRLRGGRLGILFKCKRAEYKKSNLNTKRVSFRRFISEGLVSDRLGQIVDVVQGKWRREAPSVSLVLASAEEVSTWEESRDALARHLFLQVDEAMQVEIVMTDEPDWFTLAELEFAVHSLPHNKASVHDGISLEIVRKVSHFHL